MGLLMSQDDFARALREAGDRAGVPNDANRRLVQRWEAGAITAPRPAYARALEAVTGLPIGSLGFTLAAVPRARVPGDGQGGNELASASAAVPAPTGTYSGVWLSRYEYHSSGRSNTLADRHHVVLLQHGDRLTVRSLPGSSESSLGMDLTVDGAVVTGTWVEQTAAPGYYRGARYHGAVQFLAEPAGRRLTGRWIGFGKELDINTGPWELVFRAAGTDRATLATYDRQPEPE
nr:XRE family transcriptional regulator [Micromonospora sp. DSM 115978]